MAARAQQQGIQGPSTKFIVFEDFSGGMNTQSVRQGLNEKQAAWLENAQPIAANNLVVVPGPAQVPLGNLTNEVIIKQFYFDLGASIDYVVNFCQSGSAYGVTNPGGLITQIAPAGTFSAQGGDCTALNNTRLLITDAKSGYCTWDGTLFVMQGGVSPNFAITDGGSGYTQGATVAISGGSGSGATANAVFTAGVLTGITLLTPGIGYQAGDTLTVTITAVGAGSSATANGHVWPFLSPSPTTIAVAFARVWLGGGRVLIATGTGSPTYGAAYDDFQSADASVTTTISDSDLVHEITTLRYLNGALYILGDNSVKQIASISVSSGITNFTITPLSSDQGTIYPQTVLSYNRLVLFANQVGVFAVFGASVEKISDQMDGIFKLVDFTQPLSAAVVDINNIHTYTLLVRYKDVAGTRSLLIDFFNKKWFAISQGNALTSIVTGVLNSSGASIIFGSSGSDITQLIVNRDAAVSYKIQSAMTPSGNPIKEKRVMRAGVAVTLPTSASSDLALTIDTENGSQDTDQDVENQLANFLNNAGQVVNFVNNSGQEVMFAAAGFTLSHSAQFSATGRYIGCTVAGTVSATALQAIFIEYADAAMWGNG